MRKLILICRNSVKSENVRVLLAETNDQSQYGVIKLAVENGESILMGFCGRSAHRECHTQPNM